jgi:redox-sensitive bicupin YhaK (pirin superfamily)
MHPAIKPGPVIRQVAGIRRTQSNHWVGDGFPVRTLFSGPREFPPTQARLGVGPHPHRGFETVTIVYAGEVEHRDSSGGGGRIGPGDVQWMTAASGLVHEEFHGREYARRGGPFEMVQLWVNLPAQDKMAPPRYQPITNQQIPVVDLPGGVGKLRVIAGDYAGSRGPAMTFTPIQVWDLRISTDRAAEFHIPAGHNALLVVLSGSVVSGKFTAGEAEAMVFDRNGDILRIDTAKDARALLLAGEPIEEPVVGYGPFVMNTEQEIHQAMVDYQNGKLGTLA